MMVRAALTGLVLTLCCLLGCDKPNEAPRSNAETSADAAPAGDDVPSRFPGVGTMPASVKEKIDRALAEKAKREDVEYRTRHKTGDGKPKFTNRLILESSPYLQQHAHNPVNWFPWGAEAFEKAATENKPVLLSVGYSTCHWCHVMEEESFEDLEIAKYLNENYVAIKVDREERPDIDEIYMTAVRMISGRGGWPMTVWLTPDRAPFMGGTYFPPRAGERGARKGFLGLLKEMKREYDEQPGDVARKSQELGRRVVESMQRDESGELRRPKEALTRAFRYYERSFDDAFGGWGRGNKFPMPSRLLYLLRYHRRSDEDAALEMVTATLDAMRKGGVYDHVGGGFHRYSVDRQWGVPHFEKMLYDNAQLAVVYTEAWQVTGDPAYARVVRETLDYLMRDMATPRTNLGAFYAATDADSEGEEGTFFVWTPGEIREHLAADAATAFTLRYGVTKHGNFEGKNVLRISKTIPQVASEMDSSQEEVRKMLSTARERLYEAREARVHPHRDEKIIAAWNGLALETFARAGFVFEEPRWVEQAERIARFVESKMTREDGSLLRSVTRDREGPPAVAEDYAAVIAGLLTLFEVTGELEWLEHAITLQKALERDFGAEKGGYYRTSEETGSTLLAREKPVDDGAMPSANGMAALNLLRLHKITLDKSHLQDADELFSAFGNVIERRSPTVPRLLAALDFRTDASKEVAIVHPPMELEPAKGAAPGKGGVHSDTIEHPADSLFDVLRGDFVPNMVLVPAPEDEIAAYVKQIPWLESKKTRKERATAYVCRDFSCKFPTTEPDTFRKQLAEVEPLD